ncbi:MAG: nitroreductase family deazaflavin-dependent oxidoreductase [Actinobacteria bacterium]|nr:nitroreductase family deazaflavin-dependent oxidoreductase [Actinomycetota bacterium]
MGKVDAGGKTLRGRTTPLSAGESNRARRFMRRGSAWNVALYRRTKGRLGGKWRVGRTFLRGVPVCLVTTTGRRSGLPRTVPLLRLRDGDDVVIVASQGGMPRHPDWYFNIVANPAVHIEDFGDDFDAVATVADADTRARLWPRLVDMYPGFAMYQARADREIPVVVCRRQEAS